MSRLSLHWTAVALVIALSACTPGEPRTEAPTVAAQEPTHQADIEAWRKARVERLTAPDGWLSLVGMHWLVEGEQTVGSAADNTLRLASGPAHLGIMRLRGKEVWFTADPAPQVFVRDAAALEQDDQGRVWHRLAADSSGKQTLLRSEPISVVVIERSGKMALRVKDPNAATRTGFSGIDYFPIDATFKVEGRFEAHAETKYFEIQTVLGTIERMETPGVIHFEIGGKPFTIHPVLEAGTTDWFFIFADRTNGRETYGPGRFVYAKPAVDGRVTLDFNRAYNPPCSFTPYSTCPLPPPENRLDLRVTAGEKKYPAITSSP
ncbi:MAG: DUF1684 domain-containing protein [Ahniella sp.]|nr:DUF1684 domain-containing protein [Ahniella sp.]